MRRYTLVCPGRYDPKTELTTDVHGGWETSDSLGRCRHCGRLGQIRGSYRVVEL